MIGLIQRVLSANVMVNTQQIAQINQGIVLLLAIEKNDSEDKIEKLLNKVINYRIFEDEKQRMNKSLLDIGGALLVVSQFTLAANTKSGLRPGFESAKNPSEAEKMYDQFVLLARGKVTKLQTGQFGADMQLALVNDGPVTFSLQV